jgi:hypothetical protein
LSNLGTALHTRFRRRGERHDLDAAIAAAWASVGGSARLVPGPRPATEQPGHRPAEPLRTRRHPGGPRPGRPGVPGRAHRDPPGSPRQGRMREQPGERAETAVPAFRLDDRP